VQTEARRKLKPIEIFYRRKFNFFQDRLKKQPNRLGYQLGFAVICLRYAQIWVEDGKLQEYFLRQAFKNLNQLIRIYEPKARYFYYRGQVLREFNQPRLAAEDFKKVLQQNPRHYGAMLALIDFYLQQRQPHIAIQLIKKLQQHKLPLVYRQALQYWLVKSDDSTVPKKAKQNLS